MGKQPDLETCSWESSREERHYRARIGPYPLSPDAYCYQLIQSGKILIAGGEASRPSPYFGLFPSAIEALNSARSHIERLEVKAVQNKSKEFEQK